MKRMNKEAKIFLEILRKRVENKPVAEGEICYAAWCECCSAKVELVSADNSTFKTTAREYHQSDFDGDGTTDFAVFRPSFGTWFFINSGSNTFSGVQFGQAGDIPVDGDFDGDGRNDLTVFRPSNGGWFTLRSSDGQFQGTLFGQAGDKPVSGDYGKDGKADIAVWRPSSGNYFFIKSSNGQFGSATFGQNGDIPIGSSLNP